MFNLLDKRPTNVKNDLLSGVTVALALVPEAVAFAFIAGLEPMVGLYAAFMMGLITSVFGGRPGMIFRRHWCNGGGDGWFGCRPRPTISICRGITGRLDSNIGRYYETGQIYSHGTSPGYARFL